MSLQDDSSYKDDWRRTLTPRLNSYPPPSEAIYDYTAGDCVCLKINGKWIPFINGVLDILMEPIFWETNNPEWVLTQIAELQTALHGASTLMNCPETITSVEAVGLAAGLPPTVSLIEGVLTFGIPAGSQGIQGIAGTNGTDGIDGINGTNGTDGIDGINGTNGTDGIDGINGTNGIDGIDGINGTNGTDGIDGINGTNGTDGTDGVGMNVPSQTMPEGNTNANICAAAFQTFDYMLDMFNEMVEMFRAHIIAEGQKVDVIVAIGELVTLGFLEAMPLDEIATYIRTTSLTDLEEAQDEANLLATREAAAEWLYCRAKDNSGIISPASFLEFAETLPDKDLTWGDNWDGSFSNFVGNIFQYVRFLQRWKLYSHDIENDCELLEWCPDGDHYIDHFTAGNGAKTRMPSEVGIAPYYFVAGDWVADSGRTDAGSVVSGVVTESGYTSHRSQSRFVDLGAEYTVIQAAYWIVESASAAANKPTGENIAFYDDTKTLINYPINQTGIADTNYRKIEWTGSQAGVRYIRYGHDVDIGNGTPPVAAPTYMDEIEATWLL